MVYKYSVQQDTREIISVIDVYKTIGEQIILNGINFAVMSNSIHAIIGPNGAGKTTLLRTLLKLLRNDSGLVSIATQEEKVSAMLENDYLFDSKTGQENLNAFAQYMNLDFREDSQFGNYVNILGLKEHLHKRVHKYSKGMKRKLSLLIVLMRDSELLILDEPTSGIDPESRVEIRNLFAFLKDTGKTILLTSHDLSEVKKTCDYVSILRNGQITGTFLNDNSLVDLEESFFERG